MEKLALDIERISRLAKKQTSVKEFATVLEQLDVYSSKIREKLNEPNLPQLHRDSLTEIQKCISQIIKDNQQSSKSEDNLPQSQEKEEQRERAIEQTIIKAGEVRFQDIAGLDVVKSLLHEAVILPVQYPHLFKGKVKPWKSILLYGPPGMNEFFLSLSWSLLFIGEKLGKGLHRAFYDQI